MPDFALKDSTGQTVQLSDYHGKVVLLNFWATWCAPCKIEIPWFMEFQREYKDRNFAVLGVSMDEDGWDAVRPYMANHSIQLPHRDRQRRRRASCSARWTICRPRSSSTAMATW